MPGKVGTGFTMKSALALTDKLEKLSVDKPVLDRKAMSGPGAGEFHAIHWVKPVLLCEVTFTEWTEDGHIRHPSFQGLREDKKAAEVKMEKPQPVTSVPKTSLLKLPVSSKNLVLEGITITHPERLISEIGQVTADSGAIGPLIPVGSGPRFRWELVQHSGRKWSSFLR